MSRPAQQANLLIASVLALAMLSLPATARAASTPPAVTTGGATKITATTVRLVGTVTPNGAATTYLVQYGPTKLYGTSTPILSAGSGTSKKTVSVNVANLAPATTYHYRLVAHNGRGDASGADRSFKTLAQPLALSLVASPNPVSFGHATMIGGVLTGTGNAGLTIQLQQSPFPHTAGFAPVPGNSLVANGQGQFVFTLLSVPINTQFRAILPSKPSVISPIVGVGVVPRVSTHVSARTVGRGGRVRFSGTVRPARTGQRIVVQRLRHGRFVFVAASHARKGGQAFSRYATRFKLNRGGDYRVLVDSSDGQYTPGAGRIVKIRRR